MNTVTIYDVARTAGVSIATVSRVINSPSKVNEATRQRVLAAIDELGYVPRAEARARARRSEQRIGVIAPFFTRRAFVQRLRGISSALLGTPYELIVYNADSPLHCRHYLESLPIARRLDGLVLMSILVEDVAAQRLQDHGLHTVTIETTHPAFSSVTIDNEEGGAMAARYLLEQGHRRLGFVGGDSEIPGYTLHTSALRLQGFRRALEEAGIDLPDRYVAESTYSLEEGRRMAHELFSLAKPPTAIFAASDAQAMGALKAAKERGMRVPDDVAVIGFDDLDIADYIGLTTIRQSLDESGRVAIELLLSRLSEPMRPVRHVRLPLELVPRETA